MERARKSAREEQQFHSKQPLAVELTTTVVLCSLVANDDCRSSLILNAAALAAASPTLPFRSFQNAARRERNVVAMI